MLRRFIQSIVGLALLGVALRVLAFVFELGQQRFFTIDEFQWGHATWLITQGQVPYRDFYEHHLPLGYLLHSLLLPAEGGFEERALLLREIAFAYLFATSALLAAASWVASRSGYESLLSATIPLGFGFGLMSAIDYRGDNWAAFSLIASLALLEINQRQRRRWISALAGLLFACAIGMTQKILLLGGLSLVVMLVLSLAPLSGAWSRRLRAQLLPHPGAFCLAFGCAVVVALAVGAAYGVLGRVFEITVVQALAHEQIYPGFGVSEYTQPFWRETWSSTLPILVFAAVYLVRSGDRFWALPLGLAGLGALTIKAPFPYNFVLLSQLVAICAVRGYCAAVRGLDGRHGRFGALVPALYLLPLALLPGQLGFVAGRSSNEYQLQVLRLIEQHTGPDEVVIDSAGGALFRPHRGYYWYQGRAHIEMFDDYFTNDFVSDLRDTEALLWIQSLRFRQLPPEAKQYLRRHYTRLHGELNVLGFAIRSTATGEEEVHTFDVVREGEYYVSVHPGKGVEKVRGRKSPWREDLLLDGAPLKESSVFLAKGAHSVSIRPDSPAYRFSFLPRSAFGDLRRGPHHTPLFEYERRARIPE